MGTLLGPWWVDQHSSQTVLLLLSSKDPPTSSLYTCRVKGSEVMFGGVDKSYYQGVLDWVPLIEMGDWSVHMDR